MKINDKRRSLLRREYVFKRKVIPAAIAALGLAATLPGPGLAELASLSDVPLAQAPEAAVLPNLMYILDDSGSMMWDYMPDNVYSGPGAAGSTRENCKTLSCTSASANSTCTVNIADSVCHTGEPSDWGEPPYYSAEFNQIYYNPKIAYDQAVNSDGTGRGTITPTAAYKDAYLDQTVANQKNLTNQYPEIYYCNVASPSATQLADTAVCRRNGIDNVSSAPNTFNYFLYWSSNIVGTSARGGFPSGSSSLNAFRNRVVSYTGNPYYYTITAHEYCSDENLINCALANADGTEPSGGFTFKAPLRYCSGTANAASTAVMSDAASSATPKCRATFSGTYSYPRYGRFARVDIVSANFPMNKVEGASRPDCGSGPTCTYAQELQNFANWYSYYRTRMMTMKTATGRAFRTIDDRYRVGFITINPGSPVVSSRYLPIDDFLATQKESFYNLLYAQTDHGTTPLRVALSRVGRHYAGVTDGINDGMSIDPVTHSCQQNFALLTSDGYWNDGSGSAISITGGAIGNQDNAPSSGAPVYVDRPNTGTLDGSNVLLLTQTPFTEREQVICQGSGTITNWTTGGTSGTNTTTCGCTGSLKRVWQRTRQISVDVTSQDGVTLSTSTNVNSVAFTLIADCDAKVETKVMQLIERQYRVCTFNNAVPNFDNVLDPGNTPIGPQAPTVCGCTATSNGKRRRIWERVREVKVTEVTSDGVLNSTVISTTGTAIQFNTTNCTSVSLSAANATIVTSSQSTTTTGVTVVTNLTPTNPNTVSGGPPTSTSTFAGTPNTLADIAMYYYKTDLRTTGPKAVNNVPTSSKDVAAHQHMVTFTLGLGLKGLMNYKADYETSATGDFARIKGEQTNCSWLPAGTVCNWPIPTSSSPSTLDDMWHAAVNGRGTFYSAADPNSLADGLSGALTALKIQTAAASASATSTPNVTEIDNFIYSSTFRTVRWDGEIAAQRIDTATGNVLPAIEWEARAQLNARVTSTTDTRQIWKFDSTASAAANSNLRAFLWANLSGATGSSVCAVTSERGCFNAKGVNLSQYASPLDDTQKALADDGENLVNWLRGQSRWEGQDTTAERVYRDREFNLGDAVNATPAYERTPKFTFQDSVTPTYADFKSTQGSRQGVLYVAANDGMLHAFNGEATPNQFAPSAMSAPGGRELWAYVPRITFPNLHKLATNSWDTTHRYSVDGSPQTMDAYKTITPATSATPASVEWKTILIGGFNKGGRGFYLLDITDAVAPKGLWEICHDSNLCEHSDPDIGFSYGNGVITKLPNVPALAATNRGRWVAIFTSGINNAGPGDGRGYLYVRDLFTGEAIYKVATNVGDTTTPSGLSKISAFADNFANDNTATFLYGGDLLGNIWRFDMSVDPPHVLKLAELKDGTRPQSITTRPELGVVSNKRVVFFGTGRYLGIDDTQDPATLSPPLQWAYQQAVYAIKDEFVAGASAGHGNIRALALPGGLVQQTLTDNTTSRTISNNAVNWTNNLGWFVNLNPANTSPGERINLEPQLVLGTLVVVSNVPNNNACTVGGDSFIYQFNYATGSNIASASGGQVATKFTGQITVGLVVVRLPSGVFKGIATGATGTKTPVGVNVGGAGGTGRRVSWRELLQ